MSSKRKKQIEESSSGTEEDESREINPGPKDSDESEDSENDLDNSIEMQDMKQKVPKGFQGDDSSSSQDEGSPNKNISERRKSMKINTIGLDISEVRTFNKDRLSPREEASGLSNQIQISTNAHKEETEEYSSGESEEGFHVRYSQLPKKEKEERIFYLWMQAFRKAKGAAIVIRKHIYLNGHIYQQGYKNEMNVRFNAKESHQTVVNSKNIDEENERKMEENTCLIYPSNVMKQCWDVVVVFLLLYTAIFVPFKVCFTDESTDGEFIFDLGVDFCFFVDIVLTFFTATEGDRGAIEVQKSVLAKNYFKGWFFIDLFTTIPFQILEKLDSGDIDASNAKVLRLARLPRLYRLLRIFRLFKLVRLLKTSSTGANIQKFLKLGNAFKTISKIAAGILFATHLCSCFWFFQAKWDSFPDGCWVKSKDLMNAEPMAQYLVAFHWAFQTITTVGFGDVGAGNNTEIVFSSMWMIFGVAYYSYTIGNMTALISSVDEEGEELQNKLDTLKVFSQTRKLPNRLFYRIKRHLENAMIQAKYQDSEHLLEELPIELRDKVIARTHSEVFRKIKFFWGRSMEFNNAIVHELKPINIGATELLYQQTDQAEGIYFIHSGKIKLWVDVMDFIQDERLLANIQANEVKNRNGYGGASLQKPGLKAIIMYTEGGYFGDSDIFATFSGGSYASGRDLSAIADKDSSLFVLHIEDVGKIKDQFADIFEEMKEIGLKRFKNHQILIAKEVKAFIIQAKIDLGESDSFGEFTDETEEHSKNHSLDSQIIEVDFQKAVEGLNKEIALPEMKQFQKEDSSNQHINFVSQKFVEKRQTFNEEFEKTFANFKINMQFLEKERKKASKVVEQYDQKSTDALHIMNKMNIHMETIVQDLKEVDGLVDNIKNKQQSMRR